MRIIICGLNGAGKSTLGRALAGQLHYEFRDIEDYYFPKTDDKYEYSVQRTEEESVLMISLEIVCYREETYTRVKNVSLKWSRLDLIIMQKGGLRIYHVL